MLGRDGRPMQMMLTHYTCDNRRSSPRPDTVIYRAVFSLELALYTVRAKEPAGSSGIAM